MAFTNVIRRAVSGVIPSAIRATGSQRCYHHRSLSTLFSTAASPTHTGAMSHNLFRCSFSTVTQRINTRKRNQKIQPQRQRQRQSDPRRESSETLVKAIDTEILCAADSDDNDKVEEVPKSVPFKIKDEPKQQMVTLTKDEHGERITVEVHMLKPTTGEKHGNSETCTQLQLPMVVRVHREEHSFLWFDGDCLEFGVTAYPDKIEIKSFVVKDLDLDYPQRKTAYGGPDFGELDENIQKAFHNYLDVRGINPSLTTFLHEYMINKEGKEYVGWLKKVKKMVEPKKIVEE